jgi:hypothetical protein
VALCPPPCKLKQAGSEVDNFARLRSYIQHMQEGASLLVWKENGLQLCWFWLDKECLALNWDVDEEDTEDADSAAGGSILLERIVDIVPLGAGADQLTNAPTDSSFSVQLEDWRLDIVAPTSGDFQVGLLCVRAVYGSWFMVYGLGGFKVWVVCMPCV